LRGISPIVQGSNLVRKGNKSSENIKPSMPSVLLVGAGRVAAAILEAILSHNEFEEISICARRMQSAKRLISSYPKEKNRLQAITSLKNVDADLVILAASRFTTDDRNRLLKKNPNAPLCQLEAKKNTELFLELAPFLERMNPKQVIVVTNPIAKLVQLLANKIPKLRPKISGFGLELDFIRARKRSQKVKSVKGTHGQAVFVGLSQRESEELRERIDRWFKDIVSKGRYPRREISQTFNEFLVLELGKKKGFHHLEVPFGTKVIAKRRKYTGKKRL